MQVKLRIFSDLWLSTRKQNCRQIRKVNTCKSCKSLAEGVLLNLCNHKCGKQHLTEKWGKSTDSNHVVLLPHTFWGKNLWRGNPFNPSINIHVYYPVNSFSTTVKLRSALRCKKEQKLKRLGRVFVVVFLSSRKNESFSLWPTLSIPHLQVLAGSREVWAAPEGGTCITCTH